MIAHLRHHKAAVALGVLAVLGIVQDLLPVAVLVRVAPALDELQLLPGRWILDGAVAWIPAVLVLVVLVAKRHLERLRAPGEGGPEGPASWRPMLALWVLAQVLGLLALVLVHLGIGQSVPGGLLSLGAVGGSWLG